MNKTALITGAAKRIGAVIARKLHNENFNVILHYHRSLQEAEMLCQELNQIRNLSAVVVQGDLSRVSDCERIIKQGFEAWRRLDVLINNASSFYPTKVGNVTEHDWENLVGSNLKGPFFLIQSAAKYLEQQEGNIVNIVDIHADRPLKNYPVYCVAKAGLVMLTKSMARELAPRIRVNAVAPGVILWPEQTNSLPEEVQHHIIERTCLKRMGTPNDIAETVLFLVNQNYMTGQVIAVDGGRSIRD